MPGNKPSFVTTSLWQTPHACTLMRTSPASGSGIWRSTISRFAPGLGICATFIGAASALGATLAMCPPLNSFVLVLSQCQSIPSPSSALEDHPGNIWPLRLHLPEYHLQLPNRYSLLNRKRWG